MSRAWQRARDAGGEPLRPTLAELAEEIEGKLRPADAGPRRVDGLRPLDDAGPGDLSFVHAASYLEAAAASPAAAFVVPESLSDELADALSDGPSGERPLLAVESSRLAVARVLDLLYEVRRPDPGVHATAVVGDDVETGEGVHVGPYAVVGEGSRLGDGVVVESHAVIGARCELGEGSWIHAGAVLYDESILGRRVRIHSGSVVGGPGFGLAEAGEGRRRLPQVGRVEIGDGVEIGNLSAVDRAALGVTRIGEGTQIDNFVQVGHNVVVGRDCVLCGRAALAGSAVLGDRVVLAGAAGVSDHVRLGSRAVLGVCAVALQDVAEDEIMGGGLPAMEIGLWRRVTRAVLRLPELLRRVRRLERRLAEADGEARSQTQQKSPSSGGTT